MDQSAQHPPAKAVGIAIAVASIYALVLWLCFETTETLAHIPAVWLPSALVVGVFVRLPRSTRLMSAAACAVGSMITVGIDGFDPGLRHGLAIATVFEALLVATALIRICNDRLVFADLSMLMRFAGLCLLGSTLSGIIVGAALSDGGALVHFRVWISWMVADGLGMFIWSPTIMVAIDAWNNRRRPTRKEAVNWLWLVIGSAAGASAIFAQTHYPFLFLASPIVVIAAFRTGIPGTVASIAIITTVAVIFTYLGHGPIMLVHGDFTDKVIAMKVFLASNVFIGLPVAASIAKLNSVKERLRASRDLNQSILDNVDEIVYKMDRNGRWEYLNPAWERITGYTVKESLGWKTTKLLHDVDLLESSSSYPGIVSGEVTETVLHQRFFTKQGECRHIEVTVRRLADEDGTFAGTIGNIRDVSERVAQQRALAESENRFRRMADASPIGIFRGEPGVGINYVNRNFAKTLGLTEEQSLGTAWLAALRNREEFENDPPFQGFSPDRPIRRRVLHFNGHDEEGIWVEVVNSAEFDEFGNPVGFIGAVIDITEQRRATQRLIESERRFQALANLAPAGIFRTDASGNCNYVNDAWLRLAGLGPDEWQGDGWVQALHPGDIERVAADWSDAVKKRKNYRDEFRWLHTDGTTRWVDTIGRPEIDEDGNIVGFIGVNIDITDRRRAEAEVAERDRQLMLLAANATDAVFRMDLDGRCTYASPSTRELLGVSPATLIGENLLTRFHPDDEDRVFLAFDELARGAAQRLIIAYRSESFERPGEYRWLEANCGAVRDPDTGLFEVLASIRDISKTKALEAELLDARHRAEEAVEAKSAFLANMSHEIRTPMNGVIGFTELLLDAGLTDEQNRHVMLIAESGRAMMRLLNDILDMSKIESGQMRIVNEAVELRPLVRSATRLMEPVARAKNVDLSIRIDTAIPKFIECDQLRLRQIILNLIGNAAKFTEKGWIEVNAAVEGENNKCVLRIDIRDSGVGIAPDKIDTVFQQFAQADSTIARRFGGTGLGLPISAQLARLMGGDITVQSQLGAGTVFTLRIPLRAAVSESECEVEGGPNRVEPIEHKARLRVLVAEDHDLNQPLLTAMATRAGMDPVIARNGAEAVAMVTAAAEAGTPYALVLMDMQMPEVDGLEATRRLRAGGFDAETLPIVALTANAYAEDIAACLEAGMQAHLSKPVRLRDLQELASRYGTGEGGPAVDMSADVEPVAATPAAAPKQSLAARFDQRREELIELIAKVIREGHASGQDFDKLTTLLHQYAGTAGFFGQAEQGTAAAALEMDLKAAGPDAAPAMLIERRGDLDIAA